MFAAVSIQIQIIYFLCLKISDSIRMNIKYELTTEKEIEVPLSVWMSHAKFRRDTEEQKTKKMKL